ncbi:MAG: macro domain-containing protein [Phycisphaerales bacterium]
MVKSTIRYEYEFPCGLLFRIIHGDLTEEPVDAIVNAANERLEHGGGVAAVIARTAGPALVEASREWVHRHGPVKTGSAAITTAGDLPHRHVIHAVGPIWGSGDEDAKLASAIRASTELAARHDLRRISFPTISAGVFGFPMDRCARVFVETVRSLALKHEGPNALRELRICHIDRAATGIFESEARRQIRE